MKTAIIADIHGNLPALKAVMKTVGDIGADRIICAGDIAGYYPEVNECVRIVRENCEYCTAGNHDIYLTGERECPRSGTVRLTIKYQQGIISEDNLEWIKSLPDHLCLDDMFICHGGPEDYIDQYLRDEPYAFDSELPLFVSAHTHVPVIFTQNGKSYINPGSVGQPRDGNPCASFALTDGSSARIIRVPYDIDAVAKSSIAAGFDERLFSCLYKGSKIGG